MPSIFFSGRRFHRQRGVARQDAPRRAGLEASALAQLDLCGNCEDVELELEAAELPCRLLQREGLHCMEPVGGPQGGAGGAGAGAGGRRGGRRTGGGYRPRDPEAASIWMILEKRNDALNKAEREEEERAKTYAKRQILESSSAVELVNKAETLIEDDWLGHIEEMPGNMFSVAAFGALFGKLATCNMTGIKAQARLVGFTTVSIIQLVGPPAVFFTTTFGNGAHEEFDFSQITWENKFADWDTILLTKFLGVMFLITFILNGLFVIFEEKQTWFKIYMTFQYLRRNTPNFEVRGVSFLYFGAFVNCWTVLWCCISSLVVIGGSSSPQDLLLDALGMLFLYNLDDIGGDLGFVDGDDWPGLRLAWIYEEMVKKDWQPADAYVEIIEAKEEVAEVNRCSRGCGRAAKGYDPEQQRTYTTCCRACGNSKDGMQVHDANCTGDPVDQLLEDVAVEATAEPEPQENYSPGGWMVFILFQATITILAILSWVFPIIAVFTPFSLIIPDFGG